MAPSASDLRSTLDEQGFVVIPELVQPPTLDRLRDACGDLTAQARAGKWPYLRTLPKQFPPWPADASLGIWGVQHLLHPDVPLQAEDRALLAASYYNDSIMGPAADIMACDREQDLVMELYNLLVDPPRDFGLRWHRDDVPADATDDEERARLGVDGEGNYLNKERERVHTQWNLALYDDASLIVMPGSNRRARTAAERAASPSGADLPGMKIVQLKAGDAVFYDNNIVHRGGYTAGTERLTLHGSVGRRGHGAERARNVLQHGIGEWVDRCDFALLSEGVRARAEGMRARAVEMGSGEGVGYSHAD